MMLDTSGFSTVGHYGTIALMNPREPGTILTSFGIDSGELTFGREMDCSVRLYYPEVSPIHCRIIFSDKKAFLVVMGENGVRVDGCPVSPNSGTGAATTVPLNNGSEFDIHNKTFRFTYPPRELRAQIYSSPKKPNLKEVRLSLVHSAQVFSPRPSHDPRENLRTLKSPIKPFSSSGKHQGQEQEVILVQGDSPQVVEVEKDLIILESIEAPTMPATPPRRMFPLASHSPKTTPVRKTPRPSLHKAVLLHNAQKAMLKAESERADEEEELEVFSAIIGDMEEKEGPDDAVNLPEHPFNDDDMEVLDASVAERKKATSTPMTAVLEAASGDDNRRFSMGGGAARRIMLEDQWRVGDIQVGTPEKQRIHWTTATPGRGVGRGTVTAEERKAIQERRKSALKCPGPFFIGGVPGLSPSKAKPIPPLLDSNQVNTIDDSHGDNDTDTKGYLEKVKTTVADMRRRSSGWQLSRPDPTTNYESVAPQAELPPEDPFTSGSSLSPFTIQPDAGDGTALPTVLSTDFLPVKADKVSRKEIPKKKSRSASQTETDEVPTQITRSTRRRAAKHEEPFTAVKKPNVTKVSDAKVQPRTSEDIASTDDSASEEQPIDHLTTQTRRLRVRALDQTQTEDTKVAKRTRAATRGKGGRTARTRADPLARKDNILGSDQLNSEDSDTTQLKTVQMPASAEPLKRQTRATRSRTKTK